MREAARLPTHIWASGLIRQWNQEGYPAVLQRRGDKTGGSVIIQIDRCDGHITLLGERRDMSGQRIWMALGRDLIVSAQDAAAYLEKAVKQDRDVWVLSVESQTDWPPLNAPLDDALLKSGFTA
ncbi:MAG: DUF1491 family protein [Pseudomonadota bacterium]